MPLHSGKHDFGEIDGTRVTFVEKGISEDRLKFLTALLEFNGFECLHAEGKKKSEEDPTLYDLGVTDMVFNPTVWVYQRMLKRPDGKKVTPDFWNQLTEEAEPNYWDWSKKEWWPDE